MRWINSTYQRIFALALPLVFTQAGQVLVHLVDNIMVGHVGTTELAAASFANSLFFIVMVFGMGVSFGLTPKVGQMMNEARVKEISALFKASFSLNSLVAIALLIVLWGVSFFMDQMGQPEQVVKLAVPYFRTLALSLVPFLIFFTFKQFAEGIGNTRYAMYVTLASNILNIILNYILIYGKFGLPAFGLLGAGIATFISRLILPVTFLILFVKRPLFQPYFNEVGKVKLKLGQLKSLFSIGAPIGFQLVMEVIAFDFGAIMMGWIGEIELAAHQVALGLASFTFMIANGIAMATTIRVSRLNGLANRIEIQRTNKASIILVTIFMSFCALGFILFRNSIPWLFTSDRHVIDMAAQLLILAAVFQLFDGLQVVSLGILRGLADVKIPMLMAGLAYLVVGVPLSYLLAFSLNIGGIGIWCGFVASLITASLLFYYRIRTVHKLT